MDSISPFPDDFLKRKSKSTKEIKSAGWPRISIVMPSFNQVEFIERSILSVLNQEYPNLQFIVIDGGSTDGTVGIIEKYSDQVSFWVSEKDRGQSDALNKGFSLADGQIYGWLNSDDIYLSEAFFRAVAALGVNKKKAVVFGDWLSIDRFDKPTDYNYAFDFSLNHFKYEGFHLNAQAMFWRSEVHRRFSGFDVDLHNTMDYQMILDFGSVEGNASFLRLPHTLGAFRRYEAQKTGGFTTRVFQEHMKMAKKNNYMDKYEMMGKAKRLYYRFRRALWYLRRGGIDELIKRLRLAKLHAR